MQHHGQQPTGALGIMTDSAMQRLNMVESQVRPSDVTDRRVIRAMLDLPREQFVPDALRSIAYMDTEVTVSPARKLVAPRVLAKLIQELRCEADRSVLDIGCATGYSTAILARLARRVVGLESDADLAARAQKALGALAVANATIAQGPLPAGRANEGPFDAILLNGSVPEAPRGLIDQVRDGGRIVGVLADGAFGQAVVWTRAGNSLDARVVFDAGAQPLPGFERTPEFVF